MIHGTGAFAVKHVATFEFLKQACVYNVCLFTEASMWWPNRYCFFGRQSGLLKLVSGNKARYNQFSYLKVEIHSKPLISQSKFSGTRKFTLRYQWFEMDGDERLGQTGVMLYVL